MVVMVPARLGLGRASVPPPPMVSELPVIELLTVRPAPAFVRTISSTPLPADRVVTPAAALTVLLPPVLAMRGAVRLKLPLRLMPLPTIRIELTTVGRVKAPGLAV